MITAFWIFTGIILFIGVVMIVIALLDVWGVPMDFVEDLITNDWFTRIFLTTFVIVSLLTVLFAILAENAWHIIPDML